VVGRVASAEAKFPILLLGVSDGGMNGREDRRFIVVSQ
jgi:hypothetical protein